MAFFNSAVGVLQTLVVALGAGLGIDFDIINKLANGTEVQVTKEENGRSTWKARGSDHQVRKRLGGVLPVEG